jgi:hypothetical protein
MCFKLVPQISEQDFRFHTDAQQSIYSTAYIIDSMKLYNQGFPFLYNTFYQGGGKILPGGGAAPALATPLIVL